MPGAPVRHQHGRVQQRGLDLVVQRLDLRGGQLVGQPRDHAVPAGQQHLAGPHGPQAAIRVEVAQLHGVGARRCAQVPQADHGRPQAHAHRGVGPVESRRVQAHIGQALQPLARHRVGHQRAQQRMRHTGIAVGEVVDVVVGPGHQLACAGAHQRVDAVAQVQPCKAGQTRGPGVQCRGGVDADSEIALGVMLEPGQHGGMHLPVVLQEVAVGHARQALPPPRARTRQRHGRRAAGQQPQQVGLRRRGQRQAGYPLGGRFVGLAQHQARGRAPGPGIAPARAAHQAVPLCPAAVEEFGLEARQVDAQRAQQVVRGGGKEAGRVQRLRAAVADHPLA